MRVYFYFISRTGNLFTDVVFYSLRDATDEKVFAALAKAEADADRVLDDLNAIASAASHEELAQAGELARERERVREKEAARSRNLTNGGTKATSKKEGKVSTLDETTPSPSPRARQTPYGSLTPRPSSALTGSMGSPRLVRKANTPCFSGKKAEFLSSSPRVESDASQSRVDHAEIERRTLAALERENTNRHAPMRNVKRRWRRRGLIWRA